MRAPRLLALLPLLIATAIAACGDDPRPELPSDGRRDAASSARKDATATPPDGGVEADATTGDPDAVAPPDDAGLHPDAAEPADTGVPGNPDAANPDATEPPDMGVVIPDADGDGISDADEGNGLADTDGDLMPDTLDADSDNDGIPDSVEGTADPDGDMIPAYLDTDSDGDGILDMVETSTDADADMTGNWLDTDSDGDTLLDADEGTADPDNDGTPSFLDLDSDGDSIPDAIELVADPDFDRIPAYLDLDSDGDGLDDAVEGTGDPDGDMIGNWLDDDSDGDTIRDNHDGLSDPDRDGIPSYLDLDSDGDTLPDSIEAGDANVGTPPRDSDFDATPDFLDVDSDNDNIADAHEGTADSDGDMILDRFDIDSDNDSILDDVESGDTSTVTPPIDFDNDMIPDFRDPDADGDTILDIAEGTSDPDMDMMPSFRDLDSDGDGWTDAIEAGDADPSTAPVDTDMDNIPDYLDVDADGDGLRDQNEPGCPAGPDRLLADSDGDSFVDPAEIAFGSDPCSGTSIIDDFYFVLPPGGPGANAPLVFSNTQVDRADLAINMDTTGSMGGEIANLRTSLSNQIIPGVNAAIPDVGFAVSYFEDYPISPFGSAANGDLPFRLLTRVTRNAAAAQNAVNALVTRHGDDVPESGIEALHQIATGAGTTWPGGSVPMFNPAQGLVPGTADGTIGGVGFRQDALPIIVHVTDAPSHVRSDYQRVSTGINAAETAVTKNALSAIGARVVSLANTRVARVDIDPLTPICDRTSNRILGRLNGPAGSDVDWFVLTGVTGGQQITAETFAIRIGANLDTMVMVANASGIIAGNDDITGGSNLDSRVATTLTGSGPYYVAVTAYGDSDFNGTGGQSADFYQLAVTVNGQPFTTNPVGCRADDPNSRTNATPLAAAAGAAGPPSVAACVTTCEQTLDPFSFPAGMSLFTRAVIPTCAWDAFGGGRPAGCASNQCCTGLNGAGVAPIGGTCPLTFEIDDNGTGLGGSVVTAIQALVNFSSFTITTQVRGDPAELQSSGLDTRCFIRSVIPTQATPPNACAPQPVAVDLVPPTPELDSFQNVVPGTTLAFDVSAINVDAQTGMPCAAAQLQPQLFRAYIDVVADGVTVVDTRDVIIIVPPRPAGGSN